MNNIHYDFVNTGYKLHLPVVPDANDPFTKEIIAFLDKTFGLDNNSRYKFQTVGKYEQFQTPCYKIGWCSNSLLQGKGMTIYGLNSSMDEISNLAGEIELRFGKQLEKNIKKYGIIVTEDDMPLTKNVSYRFAAYEFDHPTLPKCTHQAVNSGLQQTFRDYNQSMNPSGALTRTVFRTKNGNWKLADNFNALSTEEKLFLNGDSTMAHIDNFGELFTGKIKNGKVPQFIMDGLPKEYLQHYNLAEKDIIARIDKGTKQIVANMLEDVVYNPNSKVLKGNPPWFATLDVKIIDEAKQLLAQYEPETVKKLEQMLPQLEQKCSGLSILGQTTPFSQMKLTNVLKKPQITTNIGTTNPVHTVVKPTIPQASNKSLSWVDDVYAKFKAPKATPIATQSVVTTVNKQQTLAKQIVDSLTSKGGKNVLCIAGVSLLTLGAISIFNQNKNNMVASNRVTKRENSRQINVFNNRGNLTV